MLQNVKLVTVTKAYGPAILYFLFILLLFILLPRTQIALCKRNLFAPLTQTARSPGVYHETHTFL
jgi:hypothetical protein